MKHYWLFLLLLSASCSAQERTSTKVFPEIALTNRIDFVDPHFDQPRFSCGFLLAHNQDTFAITARHLLKFIKTKEMTRLSLGNSIKSWSLFSLPTKDKSVVTKRLLNENTAASLEDKATYDDDWLVFSLRSNHTTVKPLVFRTAPLQPGETLYVVGWTRRMEEGPQRVYEFEYYKTVDHRLLLKDVVVPEQFGGLSGAPLVDEQGQLVGIVSGGTVDPVLKQKYFSPCPVDGLRAFLESYQKR
ncbi:trypsin-like serine protease [Hymenobacter negativus]|uniref:Trypsin-like serine protease n=1 Tax=Hymenobacter negativus TaxID=2795026 RepID=A0ABS3QGV1_9BACT|nr:trypsin-like serine protease [Hymenobacter negativus]MBO2009955.1 trypsin-like serine protease [Hymenobacter negativus]